MAAILLNLGAGVSYSGRRPDPQAAYARRDVTTIRADPEAATVARS